VRWQDGELYLAYGTPGGDWQDQWSILMFLHQVHHGMNLQAAIDRPAFHNEHMLSSFYLRAAQPGLVTLETRGAARSSCAGRHHLVGRPAFRLHSRGDSGKTALKTAVNPRCMQGYVIGK
jgi:gamma-glutamyltranspeptidase / glutathione hydrolase